MRNTPRTIEVERTCPHTYVVDIHTVRASVSVVLDAVNLSDNTKLLNNEAFEHKMVARDETFEAQRGRCPELTSGDPLLLPSEREVRRVLINKALAGVRGKVMSSYQQYRHGFLTSARRQESAGLTDEAVESYVRYLLTGPKSVDANDARQIAEFLERTRGFGKLDAFQKL
jgi:hypothetical protein